MILVPINSNVPQRQTKWICVCPNCQHERTITYGQKWNIETKKSNEICKPCLIELKLIIINTSGLKLTNEQKEKARIARIGIKRPSSKKYIELQNSFNPLIPNNATRKKMSNAKLGIYGEDAPNWQGGRTKERILLTQREEYKSFRKQVLNRDNYTCQICLVRGGKLEIDHIKEWSNYPELRFDSNNCRTLCHDCHTKTDNYMNKAKRKKL